MVTITKNKPNTNWVSGTMNDEYKFEAKVFEEPSIYGIPTPRFEEGGNISIMAVTDIATGDEVYYFDRGHVEHNADRFYADDWAELVMFLETTFAK